MLKINTQSWIHHLVFSWNLSDKLCQQEVMFVARANFLDPNVHFFKLSSLNEKLWIVK